MSYATFAASVTRSLAFAAGLSAVGCASYTGVMPPADEPGLTVTGRTTADLTTSLSTVLARDYPSADLRIGDVHSFATRLDDDGLNNDFAGTALVRTGRRFKSVIFLMREDGSARFLEANGARFDPTEGGSLLRCDSKPVACPDNFERAAHQIRTARFRMAEMDATRAGLEVVIPYDDGRSGILNSLELFASR